MLLIQKIQEKIKWLVKEVLCLRNIYEESVDQNNLLKVVNLTFNTGSETYLQKINSVTIDISPKEIVLFNMTDENSILKQYFFKNGKGLYGLGEIPILSIDLEEINTGDQNLQDVVSIDNIISTTNGIIIKNGSDETIYQHDRIEFSRDRDTAYNQVRLQAAVGSSAIIMLPSIDGTIALTNNIPANIAVTDVDNNFSSIETFTAGINSINSFGFKSVSTENNHSFSLISADVSEQNSSFLKSYTSLSTPQQVFFSQVWNGGSSAVNYMSVDTSQNIVFPTSIKATTIIKSGGTATEYLMADGSTTNSISFIERKKVTLSTAQILALDTGPLELIPTPGVGKILNLISVVLKLNSASPAFSTPPGAEVRISTNLGTTIAFVDDSFITIPATTTITKANFIPSGVLLIENSPIEIISTDAIVNGGTGTIDIYLTYETITI